MAKGTTTEQTKSIPRGLQFALFVTAMAWAGGAYEIAGRAAQGLAVRFNLGVLQSLLDALFLLFLVVVGYRALDRVVARGWNQVEVLPLPRRAGWAREWGLGAAIGWGLCLAAVLPVLLSLHLHSRFVLGWGGLPAVVCTVATLLVATLAEEAIFRGYPLQRLVQAIGPTWASVVISVGFALALIAANPPRHVLMALLDGVMFGLVLSMAYLRTHALWVGWGLHFAYRAVAAVLLGLPIAGHGEFGSLMDTFVTGPRWLTGGAFGLDAAFLTALMMAGGMVVLYRATKEYAWQYTLPEIVPAGYEVTVAPPAAHVAMEKAATPPPLVQILSSTPQTMSRPDEQLRDDSMTPTGPR